MSNSGYEQMVTNSGIKGVSLLLLLILLSLTACNINTPNSEKEDSGQPHQEVDWYKPSVDTTWQWQLSGVINMAYDVALYDIDLFDVQVAEIEALHRSSRKVICYFSAGSFEDWREDANQFSEVVKGNNLDEWPGEKWLDIRDPSVLNIMKARMSLAREKGCDGVEPDNMDGYINDPGFPLTFNDQLQYNQALAAAAHELGLAIGLKNDLDQVELLQPYFDFAVNEQCFEYEECEMLLPFIEANKPVFNAEYLAVYQQDEQARNALCQQAQDLGLQTLVLPLELDDTFRFAC